MTHTPSQMPELKPCQCGKKPKLKFGKTREGAKTYTTNCVECSCGMNTGYHSQRSGASILIWNTRAASVPSDKERDEYKQKCSYLHDCYRNMRGPTLETVEFFKAFPIAPDQSETIKALVGALKGIEPLYDCDCPDDDADASIGWQGGKEIPVTFGQIRAVYEALALAEKARGA